MYNEFYLNTSFYFMKNFTFPKKISCYRSQSSAICGLLIGAGGFSEWTVLGMLMWVITQFWDWQKQKTLVIYPKITFRDCAAIAIGLLMLIYWSFPDPVVPQSVVGLTFPEIAKAIAWFLFSLTFLHTNMNTRGKELMQFIAAGLAIYCTATLVGSLLGQEFQSGYGHLYNIFSGRMDAGSTEPGYAACGVLLLLFRANKAWLTPALVLVLGFAIHAQNRTALLIIIAVLATWLWKRRAWISTKLRDQRTALISLTILLPSVFIIGTKLSIFKRFEDILISGRAETFRVGFNKLYFAYLNFDAELLSEIPAGVTVNDKWWHNLVLDSLRSGGFTGHLLSLVWLIAILLAAWHWYKSRDLEGLLLALVTFSLLSTSIPLSVGSYELITVLSLTLISLNYSFSIKSRKTFRGDQNQYQSY